MKKVNFIWIAVAGSCLVLSSAWADISLDITAHPFGQNPLAACHLTGSLHVWVEGRGLEVSGPGDASGTMGSFSLAQFGQGTALRDCGPGNLDLSGQMVDIVEATSRDSGREVALRLANGYLHLTDEYGAVVAVPNLGRAQGTGWATYRVTLVLARAGGDLDLAVDQIELSSKFDGGNGLDPQRQRESRKMWLSP